MEVDGRVVFVFVCKAEVVCKAEAVCKAVSRIEPPPLPPWRE